MFWLVAGALALASPTAAQDGSALRAAYTGDTLHALCNTVGQQDWKEGFCKGIIFGSMLQSNAPFCLSEKFTMDALYSGVLRYVSEHPDRLQLPLAQIVDEALVTTFPCR